jgi:hypothetical protein
MDPEGKAQGSRPVSWIRVLAVSAALLAYLALAVILSVTSSPSPSEAACEGVDVAPKEDLAAIATSNPPGTTYCLGAGTHVLTVTVRPEPGDAFVGAGMEKTFVRPGAVDEPRVGFTPIGSSHADAPIAYRDLDIGRFTASPDNTTCGPGGGCGVAISLSNVKGNDVVPGGVVLEDIACHDNGTACVSRGAGSLRAIRWNCFGNGFHANSRSGHFVGNACVKVNEGSLHVTDSSIHDNPAVGLWCDFCGHTAFVVEDSTLERNGRTAIQWEVSGPHEPGDHAIIQRNTIRANGNACGTPDGFALNSGILVSNAHNITIERNTFGGNLGCTASGANDGLVAVWIYNNPSRPVPPSSNVVIRSNTLAGDEIRHCTFAGVTCDD